MFYLAEYTNVCDFADDSCDKHLNFLINSLEHDSYRYLAMSLLNSVGGVGSVGGVSSVGGLGGLGGMAPLNFGLVQKKWRGWRESRFWRGWRGSIKFWLGSKRRREWRGSKFWSGWSGSEVFC